MTCDQDIKEKMENISKTLAIVYRHITKHDEALAYNFYNQTIWWNECI